MHNMYYFFERKKQILTQCWGLCPKTTFALPSKSIGLRRPGALLPDFPSCYSHHLLQFLSFRAKVISVEKEQK